MTQNKELVEYRAPWIIAFKDGNHRILRNGSVFIRGNKIEKVGDNNALLADKTINTNSVIAPGFISMHTHMHESPIDKGVAEDIQKRHFWNSNLFEILPARAASLDSSDRLACTRLSIYEHLRTGATTVMQMGPEPDAVKKECENFGLRAYIGENYRSGRWFTKDGRNIEYEWFKDKGAQDFERSLNFAKVNKNSDNESIVTGFLNPSQADTCTETLMRDTIEAAQEHSLLMQTHAAQSFNEFFEMTRRYGKTPIEWLDSIGFLSDSAIIGHGLFVAGSSWTNYPGDDIPAMARTGTSVAYSPWVFARNGIAMETMDSYRKSGINVVLGTDTTTQSMLHSARWASIITKVLEKKSNAGTAATVFNAATVDAARSLKRDDIGRIEEGAKADLCFWNCDSLFMTPMRDPVRVIVYYAEAEDLERVVIDGETVMENGETAKFDPKFDLSAVNKTAQKVWKDWPKNDWASRSVDEHVPMSYKGFSE